MKKRYMFIPVILCTLTAAAFGASSVDTWKVETDDATFQWFVDSSAPSAKILTMEAGDPENLVAVVVMPDPTSNGTLVYSEDGSGGSCETIINNGVSVSSTCSPDVQDAIEDGLAAGKGVGESILRNRSVDCIELCVSGIPGLLDIYCSVYCAGQSTWW